MHAPYPLLNRIREESPVCEISPGGIWLISRYDDVIDGLSDYQLFSSKRKNEVYSPKWLNDEYNSDFYLANIDPPEHHKRRSKINGAFKRSSVEALIPLMEKTASDLSSNVLAQDNIEFISDFAYPFIGRIITEVTGLHELQSVDQTREWIRAVEQSSVPDLDQQKLDSIKSIINQQKKLFVHVVTDRMSYTSANDSDFFSNLIRSMSSNPCSTQLKLDLANIIELLIRAGYQTTVHLLATAVIQLIKNTKLCDQVTASGQCLSVFVEETMRLYSSAPIVVRHTTQSTTLHQVTIPAGAEVWFSLASANRDPRIFNNPDEYDLHRDYKTPHIAFGHGPHICLGLHLARLEMKIALTHLLPFIKQMRCPSDEDLNWIHTMLFRGLVDLPINMIRDTLL